MKLAPCFNGLIRIAEGVQFGTPKCDEPWAIDTPLEFNEEHQPDIPSFKVSDTSWKERKHLAVHAVERAAVPVSQDLA